MKFADVKTIKEYILSKVTEEQIFSHYLDIPISDIIESINNPSHKVLNRHRFEQNPSVRFVNKYRLKMLDYGSRSWSGDCFQIVGNILRKNCNETKDFMFILNDIINTLVDKNTTYIPMNLPVTQKITTLTKIDILIRDFNKFDYNYFNKYGIRKESLINTFCIENYWIDDIINSYEYNKSDPCYCYYLGKLKDTILWKLYFPNRKENKFITNNKICIENINEIKSNRFLILIKAQKDRILLKQILKDLNISTIDIYSVLSESVNIPDNILQYLRSNYNNIFSIMDNDKAGIDATNNLIATKNIYPFFLVGHLDKMSKDVSDTSKDKGYKYTVDLIKDNYINLINSL